MTVATAWLSQPVSAGSVGISTAQEMTGLGRSFLYSLMEKGQLRYIKLGKRRVIPKAELTRLLAEHIVG